MLRRSFLSGAVGLVAGLLLPKGKAAAPEAATINGTHALSPATAEPVTMWVNTGTVLEGDSLYAIRREMNFDARGSLIAVGPAVWVQIDVPDLC